MRISESREQFLKKIASKILWCVLYLMLFRLAVQNVSGVLRKFLLTKSEPSGHLLNFTESAAVHRYRAEEHTVVTDDGYVLTVFRIPKGKNCRGGVRQPPVLIMHGLLLSSDSWLDSGPHAGLGYLISDECYDLWSGNVRGSHYSRKHLTLNPDTNPQYWQFFLHEVGAYDLPAIIDYILHSTKSQKLIYIGYSQSGMSLLIMCSERPKFCDKLRLAILLHPASRMTNTKSKAFRLITKIYQSIEPYLSSTLDFEAFPKEGKLQTTTASLCQDFYVADIVCRSILNLIDSPHPGSIDVSTIRSLSGHFPSGTSAKTLAWFNQILNADSFQNFDYGSTRNLEVYGSRLPPPYNINATNVPVVIIHGENDNLVSSKDIRWLKDQLPNVLELFFVKDPLWNHFDVPYSRHTKKLLFPKISEYLRKYSRKSIF
ncbi:unnamed protein product, partial [Iphiclides podalirius]